MERERGVEGEREKEREVERFVGNDLGTSLVVQWLRFHLPMQGVQAQSLV